MGGLGGIEHGPRGAGLWLNLGRVLDGLRVTPNIPVGRTPSAPASHDFEPVTQERDESSGWSAWICYVDASGEASERRITCKRLSGHYGAADIVHAYCHERQQPRNFRVDHITELVCVETGEVLEAAPHFALLASTGALTVEDKALTNLARLLCFLARCDGEYHPLEADALREQIERYARYFGGNDRTIEAALEQCGRLAPDGSDVVKALRGFTRMPEGPRICRYVLDAGAAIIDADRRHAAEEVQWAVEISDALKQVAGRR